MATPKLKTPSPSQINLDSSLPPGTAVGSGIGGGTLVTTEGGGVREIPQSPGMAPEIETRDTNLQLPDELRDLPEQQETFDPRLGTFVSTSPRDTRGTAVTTRTPTPEESERIREAEISGGIFDRPASEVAEVARQERENIKEFSRLTKDIQDVGKQEKRQLEKLEEQNVEGNEWVGSREGLERYKELTKKYNEKIEKRIENIREAGGTVTGMSTPEGAETSIYFKPETVAIGIPGTEKTREVPITKFTGDTGGEVTAQGVSTAIGMYGDFLAEKGGDVLSKGTGVVFDVVGEKPDVVYDVTTGEARVPTESDIAPSDVSISVPGGARITKGEAMEGVREAGETSIAFGKYAVPGVGAGFFASDVEGQLRDFDYNPIALARARPTETAVLGGTLLGLGALRATRVARQPVITRQGDEFLISTRGRRFFGRKITADISRRGIRFGIKEAEPVLRVQRKSVTPSQLPDITPGATPPKVLSLSDEPTYKVAGDLLTPIKDTTARARVIQEGEKAIVRKQDEVIFSGLSPFSTAGRIERQNVLREFSRVGVPEDVGKSLIALRQPKVIDFESKITGVLRQGESGTTLALKEVETRTPTREPFTDEFGTVLSRGGRTVETRKAGEFISTGRTTREGEPIWTGTVTEFTPTSPLGKTTERFETLVASRRTGEGVMGIKIVEDTGAVVSRPTTFEFFESGAVSRRFAPGSRSLETGQAQVAIRKPTDREIIDLDESTTARFISTGEGRSSQQFLQDLQRPSQQEMVATGLDVISRTKKAPTKRPSPSRKVSQSAIQSVAPVESIWAGTGLYERTSGAGVLDISATTQEVTPTISNIPLQRSVLGATQDKTPTQEVFQRTGQEAGISISPFQQTPQAETPTQRSFQTQEVTPRERTALTTRLSTRLQPRQLLRTQTKTTTTKKTLTRPPKVPKKPLIPRMPFAPEEETGRKEREDDDFTVFVRKKGEDVKLGEFGSLPKARQALKGELTETLRASGFISRAGEKLSFGDVGISGNGFRPGKSDPFRIVQRRGQRIKTGGEIREILKVRKSGSLI